MKIQMQAPRSLGLVAFAVGLIIATHCPAQVAGLAEHTASVEKRCKELEQKRDRAAEALRLAELTKEARDKAGQDLAALSRVVDETHKIMAGPPPQSLAEKEAYDRALSGALAAGSMASVRVQLDLGHSPADALQRVVASNPNWVTIFDGTPPRNGADGEVKRQEDSDFFMIRHGGTDLRQAARVAAEYPKTSAGDVNKIEINDGSSGGGVMLEGRAPSVGRIDSVRYEPDVNALILNERLVYFLPMDGWTAGRLCRAIAEDYDEQQKVPKDRIGVSMTSPKYLIYGKRDVYKDTTVAEDLLLTDKFLGDVVFGTHDWSQHYQFPDGYDPKPGPSKFDSLLVRFAFTDFEFQAQGGVLVLSQATLQIRVYPISDKKAPDGGFLGDQDKLNAGWLPPDAFAANAQFVRDHLDFFRQEPLISDVLIDGEVAALFRDLKVSGRNLEALAASLESGLAS